jgi:aminoglycoside phosphotransferase (APT) family kinase protein
MRATDVDRAVAAAAATAATLGLPADDAVVLHDSNKLTLRLLPCDTVARVAPDGSRVARFEVETARRLAAAGCPVGAPGPRVGPRVHERDGFAITFWTHHAQAAPPTVAPADYAHALARLHAGLRGADVPAPRFTDRVEHARRLVADPGLTPALAAADRELLGGTLRTLGRAVAERGTAEQVLHGEPHPGNLLGTADGPLFIDFETCCRGPVEFDLAHAPEEVGAHYPGADPDLLRDCRTLVLAIITTWRFDRGDRLPDGRRLGAAWLDRLRAETASGR